jgi:GxxExxY protein
VRSPTRSSARHTLSITNSALLEKVYVAALVYELSERGLRAVTERAIPVTYKGRSVGTYFADVLVEDPILLEIKAIHFGADSLEFKRMAKTK